MSVAKFCQAHSSKNVFSLIILTKKKPQRGDSTNRGQRLIDITIKKDTIWLVYDFVYTPMTDGTIIELIDDIPKIKRVYKILNNEGRFDNKKWVVGSGTLVDEKGIQKI